MSAIPFDRKIVSISPKRQITIPQKYFKMLGFENEAECILRGNELVIKPVQILSDSEFSQGDVVRTFKRTIDVLRQFTILDNFSEKLKFTAKEAIKLINTEPVNVD